MTREVYIGFPYPYLLTNQFYHQKKGFGIFTGDQLGTNVSRLQSINVMKINVILIMIKSIPLFLSYMYQMKTALITAWKWNWMFKNTEKVLGHFWAWSIYILYKDFKVSISKQILENSKQYWTLNVEVRSFWRLL